MLHSYSCTWAAIWVYYHIVTCHCHITCHCMYYNILVSPWSDRCTKFYICMKHATFALMYLSRYLSVLSHCYLALSHYMSFCILSHSCLPIVRLSYHNLTSVLNMLHSHSCAWPTFDRIMHCSMSSSPYMSPYVLLLSCLSIVRLLYHKLYVSMKHVTFTLMYLSCHPLSRYACC